MDWNNEQPQQPPERTSGHFRLPEDIATTKIQGVLLLEKVLFEERGMVFSLIEVLNYFAPEHIWWWNGEEL